MSQTTTRFVAAEVRAELGRQGRDASWLAARVGVSDMWVSRRLRAITGFTVDDLLRIAAALDVPPQQFLPRVAEELAA